MADDLETVGAVRVRGRDVDGDRDHVRRRSHFAIYRRSPVEYRGADGRRRTSELEGRVHRRDNRIDIGAGHRERNIADLVERVPEYENVAVRDEGHRPGNGHIDVAFDEFDGNGVAGIHAFRRCAGRSTAARRIENETLVGINAFEVADRFGAQPPDGDGARDAADETAVVVKIRDRVVPFGKHHPDGRDAADGLFAERPGVSDGADQFAVDIDRRTAHARDDAGSFQVVAGEFREDQVSLHEHPFHHVDDLHVELFRLPAPENGQAVTGHSRPDPGRVEGFERGQGQGGQNEGKDKDDSFGHEG